MRVKLDENLGSRAIELFKESGHQVSTVSGQDLGGASDDELIEACRTEGRVLVTLDLDFSNVLRRVRTLLKASKDEDLSGRLWIVEQDRLREYSPK